MKLISMPFCASTWDYGTCYFVDVGLRAECYEPIPEFRLKFVEAVDDEIATGTLRGLRSGLPPARITSAIEMASATAQEHRSRSHGLAWFLLQTFPKVILRYTVGDLCTERELLRRGPVRGSKRCRTFTIAITSSGGAGLTLTTSSYIVLDDPGQRLDCESNLMDRYFHRMAILSRASPPGGSLAGPGLKALNCRM